MFGFLSSNFSSVSTRRLCFCLFFIKNPVVLRLFSKFWVLCLLSKFSQTLSIRSVLRVGVIQKYTLLWSMPHHDGTRRSVVVTDENKWLMEPITNAAYCWQIINKLLHEPHCKPWSIMPLTGLQVNYFLSFQMLPADLSANFVCAWRHAAHHSPWSAEPWTRQVTKNTLYNIYFTKCA
jgi:hypothetical protein